MLAAVGVVTFVQALASVASHLAYGDPWVARAALELVVASIVFLLLAQCLSGPQRPSYLLLAYYLVAFTGIRVGLLPVYHTGFRPWQAIDVALFLTGGTAVGASVLWARRRKARSS